MARVCEILLPFRHYRVFVVRTKAHFTRAGTRNSRHRMADRHRHRHNLNNLLLIIKHVAFEVAKRVELAIFSAAVSVF